MKQLSFAGNEKEIKERKKDTIEKISVNVKLDSPLPFCEFKKIACAYWIQEKCSLETCQWVHLRGWSR